MVDDLARAGGSPLLSSAPLASTFERFGRLGGDLRTLLASKNGFYAFEDALWVLPSGSPDLPVMTLEEWNSPTLWRDAYSGLTRSNLLCFAQDILGVQFALRDEQVVTFDPETGDVTALANTLADWATAVLGSVDSLTGRPLSDAWRRRHGTLQPGERLVPKRPFVLGGSYDLLNLASIDAAKGMRLRANIAEQIRGYPDGTTVLLEVVD